LGAGLLTLLFGALAVFGASGLAGFYFPGAPDAPDLTVAGTPEQIARGEYLVGLSCVGCHSAVGADGRPTEAHPLSGGWNISAADGFGFMGDMVTENLTPAGRLADYSDGDLFRVLRYKVNQDGRGLAVMGFLPYHELSDEDTQAIIAYLRSLEPAETQGDEETGDRLNYIAALMMGAGMLPSAQMGEEVVAAVPVGATAEYGKYVATYGECRGCHGPDMTGTPASALGPAVPNPRPLVSDLSHDEFVQMMRSGVRPGNDPFPEAMPWQIAARMTDEDLAALYAYLTAPVE
jgi:cytochrome c553